MTAKTRHLVCVWCGKRLTFAVQVARRGDSVVVVCNGCYTVLDRLDRIAEEGGIRLESRRLRGDTPAPEEASL